MQGLHGGVRVIDGLMNLLIANMVVEILSPAVKELERSVPICDKLYRMRMRSNPSKYKRFYVRRGCA